MRIYTNLSAIVLSPSLDTCTQKFTYIPEFLENTKFMKTWTKCKIWKMALLSRERERGSENERDKRKRGRYYCCFFIPITPSLYINALSKHNILPHLPSPSLPDYISLLPRTKHTYTCENNGTNLQNIANWNHGLAKALALHGSFKSKKMVSEKNLCLCELRCLGRKW